MGRIGEYAQEEGGILELDGELLEAGKVSGKYWMFLLYSYTELQEHLVLTIVTELSCVLSHYG